MIFLGDNMKKLKKDDGKVSLRYTLSVDRQDDTVFKGYDFVPRDNHWLSLEEQKIKTREIEENT